MSVCGRGIGALSCVWVCLKLCISISGLLEAGSPGEEMRRSGMRRLQTRECANLVFSGGSDRLNRVCRQTEGKLCRVTHCSYI